MRRGGAVGIGLIVALGVGGCSSGARELAAMGGIYVPSPDPAGSSTPVSPATTLPAVASGRPPGTPGRAAGGEPNQAAPVPTTAPAVPARGGTPGYPLEVTGPTCVRQGSVFAATVRTRPEADLAIAVAFSDGSPHETQQIQQADPQGTYTTSIPITPKMPLGRARLLVASGREGQGAAMEHLFTVVRAGASCN